MGTITMTGIELAQSSSTGRGPVYDENATIGLAAQSDDDISGYGQPVSLAAAQEMIKGFAGFVHDLKQVVRDLDEPDNKFLDPVKNLSSEEKDKLLSALLDLPNKQVTFGRESLLMLLSQKGCEGIRFYFCKNHHNRLSLVLVGVESRNGHIQDVGTAGSILEMTVSPQAVSPMIFEVGVPDDGLVPNQAGPAAESTSMQAASSSNEQ